MAHYAAFDVADKETVGYPLPLATYALKQGSMVEGHRGHRGHLVEEPPLGRSDAPDPPYADGAPRANGQSAPK